MWALTLTLGSLCFAASVLWVQPAASSSAAELPAACTPPTCTAEGLALVPGYARANYAGFTSLSGGMKLGPSPYANWTAPKPPWKLCYSDTLATNQWRADGISMFKLMASQLKKQGLVKDVVVTDSNLNTGVQISQFNNLVAQGCHAIAVLVPTATALCSQIEKAFKKGVLVLSLEQSVNCKYGQAIEPNDYLDGVKTAEWLVKVLKGKGNILMIPGVASYPLSVARVEGAKSVFAKYPGIKIAGTVYSNWTTATAKTQILQFLSTHPEEINGVWQEGCCGDLTSAEAFKQTGRPQPFINGWGGSAAWMAHWQKNNLNSFDLVQGGAAEIYDVFHVMLRMLMGQKPKVNAIVHTVTFVNNEDLPKYYKPWMTTTSSAQLLPPDGKVVPDSYYDGFFVGGQRKLPVVDPNAYDRTK